MEKLLSNGLFEHFNRTVDLVLYLQLPNGTLCNIFFADIEKRWK